MGWPGQDLGLQKMEKTGKLSRMLEMKERDRAGRRAGKCKRTSHPSKGCREHREGHRDSGQREGRQALTFPQHEEVRLLVGVEVSEGRQGAPGLGPKEFGRDVVQRPSRDRPDSQQREPPK